jgi:hypothetical protein
VDSTSSFSLTAWDADALTNLLPSVPTRMTSQGPYLLTTALDPLPGAESAVNEPPVVEEPVMHIPGRRPRDTALGCLHSNTCSSVNPMFLLLQFFTKGQNGTFCEFVQFCSTPQHPAGVPRAVRFARRRRQNDATRSPPFICVSSSGHSPFPSDRSLPLSLTELWRRL